MPFWLLGSSPKTALCMAKPAAATAPGTATFAPPRARSQAVHTGQALHALASPAPAVLDSARMAVGNIARFPQRLGEDEARRELKLQQAHARHLQEHVAALQHGREALRAELHSAHAQLRATAAERDAARAEAVSATKHVAALQADLSATERMDKADLWCSYACVRTENLALSDELTACRSELRRAEAAIEQEAFEKAMATRSANLMCFALLATMAAQAH